MHPVEIAQRHNGAARLDGNLGVMAKQPHANSMVQPPAGDRALHRGAHGRGAGRQGGDCIARDRQRVGRLAVAPGAYSAARATGRFGTIMTASPSTTGMPFTVPPVSTLTLPRSRSTDITVTTSDTRQEVKE